MKIVPHNGVQRTNRRFVAPAQYHSIGVSASAFSGAVGNASIRKAQEAIEALSAEFPEWMRNDVSKLDEAWWRVRHTGGNEPAFESLLLAALSIKGMSAMLGYPYSGQICASLVELIQESPDTSRIPLVLIGHHVNAVKAELREQVVESTRKTASSLVASLHHVSLVFIRKEQMRIESQQGLAGQTGYRCDSSVQTQRLQDLRQSPLDCGLGPAHR